MEALRLYEAAQLEHLTKNAKATCLLEAWAFYNSVRSGFLHNTTGIPIWSYSNGTNLFETDKQEAHARERSSSYSSLMAFVKSAWLEYPEIRSDPLKIESLSIDEGHVYSTWRHAHQKSIDHAKQVLQESQETGEFIQCRKCKSNDVDTEQKQTRSADEPMTLFCRCRRCETRFVMK